MRLYEKSEGSFVLHSMEEEDVNEIAKYSNICVASDGNSLRDTGPLSSGKPHPRSYATNSRYLESLGFIFSKYTMFSTKKQSLSFQKTNVKQRKPKNDPLLINSPNCFSNTHF